MTGDAGDLVVAGRNLSLRQAGFCLAIRPAPSARAVSAEAFVYAMASIQTPQPGGMPERCDPFRVDGRFGRRRTNYFAAANMFGSICAERRIWEAAGRACFRGD